MTLALLPEEKWSKAEKWVWEQIRSGEIADFNVREARDEPLDPKGPEGWGEERRLSSGFLK